MLFKPIEGLLTPHYGTLWEKFRTDYPKCKEKAPIAPVKESFEKIDKVRFELESVPPQPRIWFLKSDETGIIQLQRDRFLHNWRKAEPNDKYPRFPSVFSEFRQRLEVFKDFLSEEGFGSIEPEQYELTYVNFLPQGAGWSDLGQLGRVLPDFGWRAGSQRFLALPSGLNYSCVFEFPQQRGRLRINIRYVLGPDEPSPKLRMELAARGFWEGDPSENMVKWFGLARDWIVRGFADLTGPDIQREIWGKVADDTDS